ncbi:MAG: hypothetical protein ABI091_15640 [Ferruginibacter sp.]
MKRALTSLNITVKRVDKEEFNSKIDTKIIELINKCDFGIADLTHVRPSVYYEAGRIHGLGREVIFTCDQKYLDGPTPEKRVHFDLVTHNIIGWTTDAKFEKDLTGRIKRVILPLQKAEEVQNILDAEKEMFERYPQSAKLQSIQLQMYTSLIKAGYSLALDYNKPLFGSRSGKKSTRELVFGFVTVSLTVKQIRELWTYPIHSRLQDIAKKNPWNMNPGDQVVVICSLSKISNVTIQRALWHYAKMDTHEKFYMNTYQEKFERVIFMDNIKSISELRVRLESLLT